MELIYMNRTERRAVAHAARKAARKAGFPQTENPTTPPPVIVDSAPLEPTISDAQLEANRRNAQKSVGPVSSEGKAKVARNAITHNLTGNQMMIRSEDVDRYEQLIADYHAQFEPVGPEETYLLQSIIDLRWRLASIPGYEAALVDMCRTETIRQVPELAKNPVSMLDMQVRSHFEKKFHNLHLQESRLARRREREMRELHSLQSARKAREEEQKKAAPAPVPAQNGFVSTTAEIGQFVASLTPKSRENLLQKLLVEEDLSGETMQIAA
jgi:hypothetical protein